jgi:glycosyltransferase involved in cell wall biosynthesis
VIRQALVAGNARLQRILFKRWRVREWNERALVDRIQRTPADARHQILPAELIPRHAWHSWDATPWKHPWLTHENLSAVRRFDQRFFARMAAAASGNGARPAGPFGFVGNLANNMAMRALPLRRHGVPITIYLHPSDRSVMSHPGWELSDAALAAPETDVDRLRAAGLNLPDVPDVISLPAGIAWFPDIVALAEATAPEDWPPPGVPAFVRQLDVLLWPSYFTYLPALEALQQCASLFAAQSPYLAYLAHRPYLAAQTGGDLWFEASRQDEFGSLQRRSYANARAILATNPWAYANARRFGFRHVLYVPLIVDIDAYSPGAPVCRKEWQAQIGGEFFVLVTARLDRTWKGSHIGLEGFIRFAVHHPEARLVMTGWGQHSGEVVEALHRAGLKGRYLLLPPSGKKRVVEYLRSADCLIDQFLFGYYGATALEAMATGLPVIMRLARDQYDALCPTGAPPALDASGPADVERQLSRMAASASERADIRRQSRLWIEHNHGVEVWRDQYVMLLNAAAAGAAFDFGDSPLSMPLSRVERAYHAAGLDAAPVFPNYDIT